MRHSAQLLQVPENLLNNPHFSVSPEIAYHRAMVLTNNQLHRLPDVDDSMSGTTAIAALLRGRNIYVANVGDSRCVLAERHGDKLVAQDLSFDQTPFRWAAMDGGGRISRAGRLVGGLYQWGRPALGGFTSCFHRACARPYKTPNAMPHTSTHPVAVPVGPDVVSPGATSASV